MRKVKTKRIRRETPAASGVVTQLDVAGAITRLADALSRPDLSLRDELQRAQQGLAERDAMAQGLQERIRELESRLAAADQTAAWLQSAIDAERQARQRLEGERAATYEQLVGRITALATETLPPGAIVLVASKGDDRLVELNGCRGWHFPQNADGRYAGYHPADSKAAVAHLEELRSQGAQYLLLPATSRWWLDHYVEFRRHLEDRYTLVRQQEGTCHLYALRPAPHASARDGCLDQVAAAFESFEAALHRPPAVLDWQSGVAIAAHFPDRLVFSPPDGAEALPYLDGTIDIVVCAPGSHRGEARRVAAGALVTVTRDGDATAVAIEWIDDTLARGIDASIIIPCHNGAALTEACLCAVTTSLPANFAGEIIVVDDASTDDTPRLLKAWGKRQPRLKVVRRRTNGGFIAACNQGAKSASGAFLVFLNNDTEPAGGWLTALLHTFNTFPNAGAVGGKLVLPGGTLQEAGGLIFSDGSAANFARGERDLDAPLINYVREVDYCSGALLATPRVLFEQLGGFDDYYAPAYYEDVDYCFRVRAAGYGVYYQPASRVLHREGSTSGTDLTRGPKRFQTENQHKFAKRWRRQLAAQPLRPAYDDRGAWQALAARHGFQAGTR